jgi:hypothetical protein
MSRYFSKGVKPKLEISEDEIQLMEKQATAVADCQTKAKNFFTTIGEVTAFAPLTKLFFATFPDFEQRMQRLVVFIIEMNLREAKGETCFIQKCKDLAKHYSVNSKGYEEHLAACHVELHNLLFAVKNQKLSKGALITLQLVFGDKYPNAKSPEEVQEALISDIINKVQSVFEGNKEVYLKLCRYVAYFSEIFVIPAIMNQ